MTDKRAKPGQRAGRKILSAAAFNRAQDAAEQYEKRYALGQGIDPRKHIVPTDCIKVKNDSGANRLRGDVLELVGLQTTVIDPEHLWLTGDTPTAASQPFCVLRQATRSGSIDVGQVSGVCLARINITDTAHTHADLDAGSHELTSGTSGPARILYQPGTTGIQECIVNLSNPKPVTPFECLILEGDNPATVASFALLPWKTAGGFTTGGPNRLHTDPDTTDGTGTFTFGSANATTVTINRAGWYQLGFDCDLTSTDGAQSALMAIQILSAITTQPLYNVAREQDIEIDNYGAVLNYTLEQTAFAHPIFLHEGVTIAMRNQAAFDVIVNRAHLSFYFLNALPDVS